MDILYKHPFTKALYISIVIVVICSGTSAREYCGGDDFNVQCSPNEIILMEKAQYGRMKNGKCIQGDLGYLGCYFDALAKMDDLCSGKQACHIPKLVKQDFQDIMTDNPHQCHRDLELYLEAHHICVPVLNTDHVCRARADRNIHLSASAGYINSQKIKTKQCLSDRISNSITFYVETLQGQQINVSLIDLGAGTQKSWHKCITYGKIIELGTMQQTKICGGLQRLKNLIVSNSNGIEIQLEKHQANNFLLHFEALGCPDIPAPQGGWTKREGQQLNVACYTSQQRWTLTCEGNRWKGVIGNCSAEVPKAARSLSDTQTSFQLTSEVWMALVIALSVIVLVSGVTFGVVCWRRRTLQLEIAKMKATGRAMKVNKAKDGPESEYMFPNFRPRSTTSQTEDAVYDFCFSPGSTQGTLPNNMTSSVTLPCRGSANIQYNNMVPYPAPPESPKYKTLVVIKP